VSSVDSDSKGLSDYVDDAVDKFLGDR